MHRKHIRRWHKLLAASASLVAILAGLFVAPATAATGPQVSMFWADTASTNQLNVYFYLMTDVSLQSISSDSFITFGTATGCQIENNFSQSSFQAISVSGCSEGTVALQLGANSISDSHGNWGPGEGAFTNFTIIDRTAPAFTFANQTASIEPAPFSIQVDMSESAKLVAPQLAPTISGEGCSISKTTEGMNALIFEITGCNPGAQVALTIQPQSFYDFAGNLGPVTTVASQTFSIASPVSTQVLPSPVLAATPTATPTSTPTSPPAPTSAPSPTPTPTPTATPQPTAQPTQAAVPIVEPVEPPAPPALEPEPIDLSPEQLVPVAVQTLPTVAPDLLERVVAARVAAKPQPPVELPVAETPVQQAAEPQVISAATNFESKQDLSWLAYVMIAIAALLAAIAAALLIRRRVARMPRLRIA